MKRRTVWSLVSTLVIMSGFCPTGRAAQAEQQVLYIPVYLDEPFASGPVDFSTLAGSIALPVLSASPMEAHRPLLVVIDPTGYVELALRKRIAALFGTGLPKPQRIRVGIVGMNGILFDPPIRNGALPRNRFPGGQSDRSGLWASFV